VLPRLGIFGRARANWLDDVVADAERAEQLGLDTFWMNQAFALDGLTAIAVSGQKARTIRLGAAVVPIFTRHPQALAAQAMTVQAACQGRLTLGVGLSHQHVVEGRWGYSFGRPVDRMREYLAALLPLMRGESPEVHGDLVTSSGSLETGGLPPPVVLLGALGPAMLRLAGTVADGTITAATGPKTLADYLVPTITEAAQGAGRPPPRIVACCSLAITGDRQRAERMKVQMAERLRTFPSYRAMVEREGDPAQTGSALIGSEEEVEAGIARLAATGITDIAFVDASFAPADCERTRLFVDALVASESGRPAASPQR
jgi:F420-dependent oxidoreductase-like protein